MPAPKGNKQGKQFKPGDEWRGNANGRPKGKSLTERVREAIEDQPDVAAAIVKAGVDAAQAGDFHFWKYIFDRLDGMPTQTLDANVDATIRVVFADEDSVKQAQLYGTEAEGTTEDA